MTAETNLEFDGWTVNRVSGEISRDGRTARLAQQPLRILIELHDHAGHIVTRERLVKVLWPEGVVDFDNGLNVAMRKLRVALDDVADTPRYIETLPKVGYRFIAKPRDTRVEPATAPKPPSRARGIALLLVVMAALGGVFWWWSGSKLAPPRAKHVPSVRAQELYLEGIHERSRRDTNTTLSTMQKFEAALKEDPNYAEAWVAYSFTFTGSAMRQMYTPAYAAPRARAAAQRALDLAPELGDAHVIMAHVYLDFDKDFAKASRELEIARQLEPRTARFWHYSGMLNGQLGRVDPALADMRKARELEPMTLLFTANYSLILVNARRYDEVIELLTPIVAANPGFDLARGVLARALAATGDLEGARQQLEARKEIGLAQADLALVFIKLGRRDDALRELERIQARGREGFGTAYDEALIHTGLGELDRACERLEGALKDTSIPINWMRLDPRMDALRGRKCFADVEKRFYGGY